MFTNPDMNVHYKHVTHDHDHHNNNWHQMADIVSVASVCHHHTNGYKLSTRSTVTILDLLFLDLMIIIIKFLLLKSHSLSLSLCECTCASLYVNKTPVEILYLAKSTTSLNVNKFKWINILYIEQVNLFQ